MAELGQELKDKLQQTANEQNALLMSLIAPDSIVRTSPAFVDYVNIKVQDLYTIEKKIEDLKNETVGLPEKLHLIVHTPGGDLAASTKIAMYLQKTFGSKIHAFVPYEAASGGTILCLAANNITMDAASNLTPIDPQVIYNRLRVSSTSYEQAIKDFKRDFGNLSPDEIPSPYQQLVSKFDPVIAKEMSRIAWDTLNVAYKLLLKSQNAKTEEEKKKLINTIFEIGNSDLPHGHIISADEAKSMGLNIDDSNESLTLIRLYKEWVSVRLKEEQSTHVIDTFCPSQQIRLVKEDKNVKPETNKNKKKQ